MSEIRKNCETFSLAKVSPLKVLFSLCLNCELDYIIVLVCSFPYAITVSLSKHVVIFLKDRCLIMVKRELQRDLLKLKLYKIPKFHLISSCRNFVEAHCFHRVCENCAFPQNFRTSKWGETTIFYAVNTFYKVWIYWKKIDIIFFSWPDRNYLCSASRYLI